MWLLVLILRGLKADSPHELTGPLLVNQGVTLTIEAGATVNLAGDLRVSEGATLKIEPGAIFDLKNYDLLINGTLRANGNNSEKIYLNNGGTIEFTPYSNGWDDQTGSGCIIENAFLEKTDIFTSVPLKMNNNTNTGGYIHVQGDSLIILNNNITGQISVGGSSIIRGNTLDALSITGGSVVVSNNTIDVIYDCYGSPEISNNFISAIGPGGGSGGSPIISNNNIGAIGQYSSTKDEIMYFSTYSSIITNNIIKQELYLAASSATISNNTFLGFVHGEDLTGRNFLHHLGFSPILSFSGNGGSTIISHNKITGHTYDYLYEFNMPWTMVVNDTVTTSGIHIKHGSVDVINNTIINCQSGISGGKLIGGNRLTNNRYGVSVDGGNVVIRNNIVTNGENGIAINEDGTAIIEKNFISNYSDYGISIRSQATIQNNTISNTSIAIKLDDCPSAAINYNNIENYHNNSIYLEGTSSSIDATNNWWGTTDAQAINLTIHDYKFEFDLGRVTFVPFLTEPNPEEMSTPIPEFPSWTILPLLITATALIIFCKQKLKRITK